MQLDDIAVLEDIVSLHPLPVELPRAPDSGILELVGPLVVGHDGEHGLEGSDLFGRVLGIPKPLVCVIYSGVAGWPAYDLLKTIGGVLLLTLRRIPRYNR